MMLSQRLPQALTIFSPSQISFLATKLSISINSRFGASDTVAKEVIEHMLKSRRKFTNWSAAFSISTINSEPQVSFISITKKQTIALESANHFNLKCFVKTRESGFASRKSNSACRMMYVRSEVLYFTLQIYILYPYWRCCRCIWGRLELLILPKLRVLENSSFPTFHSNVGIDVILK
jgi:hypothetical protein